MQYAKRDRSNGVSIKCSCNMCLCKDKVLLIDWIDPRTKEECSIALVPSEWQTLLEVLKHD